MSIKGYIKVRCKPCNAILQVPVNVLAYMSLSFSVPGSVMDDLQAIAVKCFSDKKELLNEHVIDNVDRDSFDSLRDAVSALYRAAEDLSNLLNFDIIDPSSDWSYPGKSLKYR